MERHKTLLKTLCRVCGKRPKGYAHSKKSAICRSLLLFSFGLEVDGEPEDIYPTSICNSCFRSAQRIKSSKESGVLLESTLSVTSWLAHSDTPTCQICQPASGGGIGRPKKWKGKGRTCDDDTSHRSRAIMRAANNIQPPQYCPFALEASLFLPTQSLPRLQCQMCQCIPNTPLELSPCRHLICYSCVRSMTECGTLTCKCDRKQLEGPDICLPHPVVLDLLGDLILTCPHNCGQVLQLQHLDAHLEANCTTTVTPPLSDITVQQLLDLPSGSALETAALGKLVDKLVPSSGSFTLKSSTGKVYRTALT